MNGYADKTLVFTINFIPYVHKPFIFQYDFIQSVKFYMALANVSKPVGR